MNTQTYTDALQRIRDLESAVAVMSEFANEARDCRYMKECPGCTKRLQAVLANPICAAAITEARKRNQ